MKLVEQQHEIARYHNPWHRPGKPEYGPEMYETTARPTRVGEYLIYERVPGECWDVVLADTCVTQRAGKNGAIQWIKLQNELQPAAG